MEIDSVDGIIRYSYWYDREGGNNQRGSDLRCVQLLDIPNTLSGDILRLNQNLPGRILRIQHDRLCPSADRRSYIIRGDDIEELSATPQIPDFESNDEDLSSELAGLPKIDVDPSKHFVKKGKYRSEIRNLLACQRNSCNNEPISPHIVRLLGKSSDDKLVFEKHLPCYILLIDVYSIAQYKSWLIQNIDGLTALHSLGIALRDLRIHNLVFSEDKRNVRIIDLESHGGDRIAPEIAEGGGLDSGWTTMSDVYDMGWLIRGMLYGNAPPTYMSDWQVPAVFRPIVEACERQIPMERPSLSRLRDMILEIDE